MSPSRKCQRTQSLPLNRIITPSTPVDCSRRNGSPPFQNVHDSYGTKRGRNNTHNSSASFSFAPSRHSSINSRLSTSYYDVYCDVRMAHDTMFSGPEAESAAPSIASSYSRRPSINLDNYSNRASMEIHSPHSSSMFHINTRDSDGTNSPNIEPLNHSPYLTTRSKRARAWSTNTSQDNSFERAGLLEAGNGGDEVPDSPVYSPHVHKPFPTVPSTVAPIHTRHNRKKYFKQDIRQDIWLPEDDALITIYAYRTGRTKLIIYSMMCCITLGLGYLMSRWIIGWRVFWLGKSVGLDKATWVVIQDQWGNSEVQHIQVQHCRMSVGSIFGGRGTEWKSRQGKDDTIRSEMIRGEVDEEEGWEGNIGLLRYFDYRYTRLCYHPLIGKFASLSGWKDENWRSIKQVMGGISNEVQEQRQLLFGANVIDLEEKSVGQLLMAEILHPFYIFQMASIILWCADSYYYYAACIFGISLFSIVISLVETRKTMRQLREESHFECQVRVLRNGFWRYINSRELVPGDVIEITNSGGMTDQVACDCFLLSGTCLVNECMLTGESIPVSKVNGTDQALENLKLNVGKSEVDVGAKHLLYAGTKIIRMRRSRGRNVMVLALVIRTGLYTTKGTMIRSILFPKPVGNLKFYRDSFRYIGVIGIVTGLGFIGSLINFVRMGKDWRFIILRTLDLITIAVPPALPATLTIGTNFAISRLRKHGIFCTSPQRINLASWIDVMCFDKTGTLTEEGMDVLGIIPVSRGREKVGREFVRMVKGIEEMVRGGKGKGDNEEKEFHMDSMIYCMATCHSLRQINGELVGDPMEMKMQEFTGWTFEENEGNEIGGTEEEISGNGGGGVEEDFSASVTPNVARPGPKGGGEWKGKRMELGILREFEFESQLRRASVVVREYGARGVEVYVKGAPESIIEICRKESIPGDFTRYLSAYTHAGYRVIGCGRKGYRDLTWRQVQKLKREEVENEVEFIGLIIFENKVKKETERVIKELEEAKIRTMMCTGDNVLTGISVGRRCGMIREDQDVYIGSLTDMINVRGEEGKSIRWQKVEGRLRVGEGGEDGEEEAEEETMSNTRLMQLNNQDKERICLALTGQVFGWVTSHRDSALRQKILEQTAVFARMSPTEKGSLVDALQCLPLSCGFCGDGANDSAALKVAHVGIGLRDGDGSVAGGFAANKSSRDIQSVIEVIREGRCALTTSYGCFKYLSLYSAIQFTTVTILYTGGGNLGDFQYLMIDLAIILPLAISMGRRTAYPGPLSKSRPTSSLLSCQILFPILTWLIINVCEQVSLYFIFKPYPSSFSYHISPDNSNQEESSLITSPVNTGLFLGSCFLYILTSITMGTGAPFQDKTIKNFSFILSFIILLTFVTLITFYFFYTSSTFIVDPPLSSHDTFYHTFLLKILQLSPIPQPRLAYIILFSNLGFLGLFYLVDHYLFPPRSYLPVPSLPFSIPIPSSIISSRYFSRSASPVPSSSSTSSFPCQARLPDHSSR